MVKRKYHFLFSSNSLKKPGPKGPDQLIIDAVIEMKTRNVNYGCRRISMQISNAFGIDLNKYVVRRILSKHYKDRPKNDGPSWLTFIIHTMDSLWSIDLFRAELIHLKSHSIMVVMDHKHFVLLVLLLIKVMSLALTY